MANNGQLERYLKNFNENLAFQIVCRIRKYTANHALMWHSVYFRSFRCGREVLLTYLRHKLFPFVSACPRGAELRCRTLQYIAAG